MLSRSRGKGGGGGGVGCGEEVEKTKLESSDVARLPCGPGATWYIITDIW